MGFGTLFVASLFLFNFIYFGYTDLICALLTAMALIRLSPVKREFRVATYVCYVFAAIGLAELILSVYETFRPLSAAHAYLTVARYAVVGTLTVCILLGIRATAKEVGLGRLCVRCESTLILPVIVYLSHMLLEIPGLFTDSGNLITPFASIMLLLAFVMHVINAVTIYKAYARICMPDDVDMNKKKAPSRFAFVNAMRAKEEEREAAKIQEAKAALEEKMRRKKAKKKK